MVSIATSVIQAAEQVAARAGLVPSHFATPFVVVGGPRTGSTLLQRQINSHPNIVCMHEVLKGTSGVAAFSRQFLGRRGSLLDLRRRDMPSFIRALLTTRQPLRIAALGFKAMFVHPEGETEWLQAWETLSSISGLRVIWIDRNPIDSVLSFALARSAGAWVSKPVRTSIELDPSWVVRRLELEKRQAMRAAVSLSGSEVLRISYKDLAGRIGCTMSQVFRFLGAKPTDLQPALEKQDRGSFRTMIRNFDQVVAHLEGSSWAEALSHSDAVRLN